MRMAQDRAVLPGRVDANSNRVPSGDQRGFELSTVGTVIRRAGVLPSAGASQISLCRRFSFSTTVVTVKAIRRPSGDTAGSDTVVTRCQSGGVKARPWAMAVAGTRSKRANGMGRIGTPRRWERGGMGGNVVRTRDRGHGT